jgi:aspartate aminotransferase
MALARTESKHALAARLRLMEESSTMAVMIKAQKLRAQGVDVVDLGAGEPDFNTPENVKAAAKRAIDANFTRYTPASGTPELRNAIAERFRRDFGVELRREEVIATVGGKQSIFNLLLALVDPGDEVLIPAPYWVTFPQIVYLCEGTPVVLETSPEDGFQVTAEAVGRMITDRTKVLILNSPGNPTGSVIPRDEFVRICEVAAERDVYVLSDECYQRFLYDGLEPYTAAALPEALRHRILVSGSLSKTYAMTGWRLGYTIAPTEVISAVAKIQGHETSNPTSITQAAAVEALTGPQESVGEMIREYQRRRDFLVPALNALPGVRCFNPQGAFYVFPDIRAHLGAGLPTSDTFCARLLDEAHVAVTPGSGFGTDGFLRISYAAAYSQLEEAVRRIGAFLSKLG